MNISRFLKYEFDWKNNYFLVLNSASVLSIVNVVIFFHRFLIVGKIPHFICYCLHFSNSLPLGRGSHRKKRFYRIKCCSLLDMAPV
jgi:hypothetical protein